MTLAAGNLVYLAANDGLMSDPPLFGVVDLIGGTDPNNIRINWENGMQQFYGTISAGARIVEIAIDSDQSFIGEIALVSFSGKQIGAQIVRTFYKDPDGANERSALLRIPGNGLWIVAPFTNLE
jgi:hypothetical protein